MLISQEAKLEDGPKVDFSLNTTSATEERKSTIGVRKVQPKKSGVSMKDF